MREPQVTREFRKVNSRIGRAESALRELEKKLAGATGNVSASPRPTSGVSGTIVAGQGLYGGGSLPGTATLNVGAGDGIDVASASIAVDVTDIIDTAYGLVENDNDIRVNIGSGLVFNAGAIDVDEANIDHGLLGGLGDDDHPQYAALAQNETVTGAWTFDAQIDADGGLQVGDDLVVGPNLLFVDYSGSNIGINCAPDAQFDLDVAGNFRAQGWIVGKHAIQLSDALMICHFDGPEPYETDFTGDAHGHMGQVPTIDGGVIFRPGKFGKAVQVAEATTNLCTNPSFEVNLAGWSSASLGTLTRTDSEAHIGSYSCLVESGGGQIFAQASYPDIPISGTSTYTWSVWVKNRDIPVGDDIKLRVYWKGGANPNQSETQTVALVADADDWIRVFATFEPDYTDRTSINLYVIFEGVTADGQGFYLDAAQLEERGYATPYCDGSLGPGHSWSGTAHNSTSSRSASSLLYPDIVPHDVFSIFGWFQTTTEENDTTSGHTFRPLQVGNYYGNSSLALMKWHAHDTICLWFKDLNDSGWTVTGSGSSVDWKPWDKVFFAIVYDYANSSLRLYTGVEGGTLYAGTELTNLGDGMAFGKYKLGIGEAGCCNVDDLAVIGRAMTFDEIRAIFESGAPVFAETSTWHWRTPNTLAWADAEGLWAIDDEGDAAFGVSGVDNKSWGGLTLDKGDVLLGGSSQYVLWDASAALLEVVGTIKAQAGEINGLLDMGDGGEIRLGAGTPGSNFTGLRLYRNGSTYRFEGRNNDTLQAYFDSDGKLVAGGGDVVLNADGITISQGTGNPSAIRWMDGSTLYSYIRGNDVGGYPGIVLYCEDGSDSTAMIMRADSAGANGDIGMSLGGLQRFQLTAAYLYLSGIALTVGDYASGLSSGEIHTSNSIYVNDNSNAKQTLGLTINQAGYDDEIISLKSSDVAHGMTNLTETDTFAFFQKHHGSDGGLRISSFREVGAYAHGAMTLWGYLTGNAETGKTTSNYGVIALLGSIKSGTGATYLNANGNILSIGDHDATRFIFDKEGDFYYDGSLHSYDMEDDLALLHELNQILDRAATDPKVARMEALVERPRTEALGIVTLCDNGLMMSSKRHAALLRGAILQLDQRIARIEKLLTEGKR